MIHHCNSSLIVTHPWLPKKTNVRGRKFRYLLSLERLVMKVLLEEQKLLKSTGRSLLHAPGLLQRIADIVLILQIHFPKERTGPFPWNPPLLLKPLPSGKAKVLTSFCLTKNPTLASNFYIPCYHHFLICKWKKISSKYRISRTLSLLSWE